MGPPYTYSEFPPRLGALGVALLEHSCIVENHATRHHGTIELGTSLVPVGQSPHMLEHTYCCLVYKAAISLCR